MRYLEESSFAVFCQGKEPPTDSIMKSLADFQFQVATKASSNEDSKATHYTVSRSGFDFELKIHSSAKVNKFVRRISENRENSETLAQCFVAIEVLMEDLEHSLSEVKTLIDLQAALVNGSRGFCLEAWTGRFVEPEKNSLSTTLKTTVL